MLHPKIHVRPLSCSSGCQSWYSATTRCSFLSHFVLTKIRTSSHCGYFVSSFLFLALRPYIPESKTIIQWISAFCVSYCACVLSQQKSGKWQDRIPNTATFEYCNIISIKLMLFQTQFRWCGHVTCMSDERIPKRLLYDQLPDAKHHPGSQRKRYKDQLRVSLKVCVIDRRKWKELATDRSDWRELCYNAVNQFEERRIDCAKNRHAMRKARSSANTTTTTPTAYICSTRGRDCSFQITTDATLEIRRVDDSVQTVHKSFMTFSCSNCCVLSVFAHTALFVITNK